MNGKNIAIFILFLLLQNNLFAQTEGLINELSFVRSEIEIDFPYHFILEPKTKVKVVGIYGAWVKVERPGRTKMVGFVPRKNIQIIQKKEANKDTLSKNIPPLSNNKMELDSTRKTSAGNELKPTLFKRYSLIFAVFFIILILITCKLYTIRERSCTIRNQNNIQETHKGISPCDQHVVNKKNKKYKDVKPKKLDVIENFNNYAKVEDTRQETYFPTVPMPESNENKVEIPQNYRKDWNQFEKTIKKYKIKALYHFTDRKNLASIRQCQALYSWKYLEENGIAIPKPGGNSLSRRLDRNKNLEDYVRLGFNKKHPMMFVALNDGRIKDAIILEIDPCVIYFKDNLFSNMNAACAVAEIGHSIEDFVKIDFGFAIKDDRNICNINEKNASQAEVLVKTQLPYKYVKKIHEITQNVNI